MKLTKANIDNDLYQSYEGVIVYLKSQYFGEELIMICDGDSEYDYVYKFMNCYKIDISHCIDYHKERMYKDCPRRQLSFYLVDWDIEIEDDLYKIKMTAFPLYIEVWCKEMKMEKIRKDKYEYPNYENV